VERRKEGSFNRTLLLFSNTGSSGVDGRCERREWTRNANLEKLLKKNVLARRDSKGSFNQQGGTAAELLAVHKMKRCTAITNSS